MKLLTSILCLHFCHNVAFALSAAVLPSSHMSYKIEELPDSFGILGEGPHWDIETQSLYFVDIDSAKLFRYDNEQNKTYSAIIAGESAASFIIPVEGESGKFAVGCGRRVAVVSWDGVSPSAKVERIAYSVQPGEEFSNNRFNDGKADPRGRLFAGTMYAQIMERRTGELYRFEKGKPVALIKTDIGISNGLAWNEKTNKFYYIDTMDYEVKEYDYNFDTGVPSNPRVVYKHPKHWPDGMTIDSEGNIYVALFTAHTVCKVNPRTSEVLQEIRLPTKHVTSVAFGGPNLDILFVTTSAYYNAPPPGGKTFKITGLGAKGLPMSKARI